jgi:hypothetical protein
MKISTKLVLAGGLLLSTALATTVTAQAKPSAKAQATLDYWTADRIAAAQPRDLFIDHRGLGYTKNNKGKFVPYGLNKEKFVPMAKPDGVGGGKPGGNDGGGDTVGNAGWTLGGDVQNAVGRILFRLGTAGGYVCSGTVVTDGTSGRSIIQTAAHCVYDDANGNFANDVIFIPNQDATTGSGTNSNCNDDILGCWVTSFGVVEQNWTNFVFPDNIPWDYAYYVVDDNGSHQGNGTGGALDGAVNPISIQFSAPNFDDGQDGKASLDFTHGLGYSYSDDPNFMYCADDMTENGVDNWWIPACDLSGGSSGGPWIQPMNESAGTGPLISVNSWGYTRKNLKGMAGPKLSGTTAQCVFNAAKSASLSLANAPQGDQGFVVDPSGC